MVLVEGPCGPVPGRATRERRDGCHHGMRQVRAAGWPERGVTFRGSFVVSNATDRRVGGNSDLLISCPRPQDSCNYFHRHVFTADRGAHRQAGGVGRLAGHGGHRPRRPHRGGAREGGRGRSPSPPSTALWLGRPLTTVPFATPDEARAWVESNKTNVTYDRQLPTKQAEGSTKQNRIAEARRLLDAASKQAAQVGGAEPAEHRTQAWGRTKCARCEPFSLCPKRSWGLIAILRYLIPDSRMTRPYSIYFLRK
jgi:hypothetical protein